MSLTSLIPGGSLFARFDYQVSPAGNTASTISASGHKFAVLVQALAAGNVRKVHFLTSTVTTGDDVRASIQGIDGATGDPDGTIANSGNSAANVTVASSDDNVWKTTAAFTTDYTVAAGDQFFVVLDFPSYVAGNMQIRRSASGSLYNFNYVDVYAASWTKSATAACMSLEQSDGTFLPCIGLYPSPNTTNVNFNSSSSPNEYALRFSLAAPARLLGLWFWSNNFSGDTQAVLYTGGGAADTTATATSDTYDKDVKHSTTTQACYLLFDTPASLTANTVYRLSIKPTTTTSVGYTRPSAGESNAVLATLGIGTGWYESTRAGGNWTDNTNRAVAIFPLLVGADDGASGGGGAGPLIGPGRLIR